MVLIRASDLRLHFGPGAQIHSVFDSKPSPRFGLSSQHIEKQEPMVVLELCTTPFAIYRHQAKIFIVFSDGPIEMAAERFFICQRVKAPGDY